MRYWRDRRRYRIEEAKRYYKDLTGEDLDVENCQETLVEVMTDDRDALFFSLENAARTSL